MTLRRVLWVVTGVYWVVLFVTTHLPPNRLPKGPSNDKLEHFVAYFVLSVLLGAALWQGGPARRRLVAVIVLAVAALYGVFDELTQVLVGRDAELLDWCADVAGAASAALVLFLAHLFTRRARPESDTSVAPAGA